MLWYGTFLAVDNFDFTRKIVKKKKKIGGKTRENVVALTKCIQCGGTVGSCNSNGIQSLLHFQASLIWHSAAKDCPTASNANPLIWALFLL